MEIYTDGSGQKYIQAGAVRVTFVPADKRQGKDKDWSRGPVIRFSAYADPNGRHDSKVYPGPEYPLDPEHGVLPLFEALAQLAQDAE